MATEATVRPKKTREIRASRAFFRVLKLTLAKYLSRRFNLSGRNLDLFERVRPPFLLLPNHATFWDPFLLGSFLPYPVYYVTADAMFRNPGLRLLLNLLGSIPKSKAISDLETVKNIVRIKSRGGVIGVFPEGRRSWDGHTLQLIYSTAKLVKLLKIPVVTALMTGAYLSMPRWTRHIRRGRLTVDFRLGIDAAQIASLSVDEIYERLTGLLAHDEFDWQRRNRIPFQCRRRAEYLERVLFTCPCCRAVGTLASHGDELRCGGCGFAVLFNELGLFESRSGELPFETLRDWNLWQIGELQSTLGNLREQSLGTRIFIDGPARLFRGYRSRPLQQLRFGSFALYPERAVFYPLRGGEIAFNLTETGGINVVNGERLEMYVQNTLYRFTFRSPRVSAYKWMLAMNILRGLKPEDISFQA